MDTDKQTITFTDSNGNGLYETVAHFDSDGNLVSFTERDPNADSDANLIAYINALARTIDADDGANPNRDLDAGAHTDPHADL
jgi:hypothetical protein